MNRTDQTKLGILMLDTKFPRIPGDIGNAETWDFPVEYAIVRGATPQTIVCDDSSPFVQDFLTEGRRLVANGCAGIATSCGFLAPLRPTLAKNLGVPVAASALEQAQLILSMIATDRTLGILTISKQNLTSAHLNAAGVPVGASIVGLEETDFGQSILGNQLTLDVERARTELVNAAKQLIQQAPETGAILLECTNMPPYAADIQEATGVPVYSIHTYLTWFHAGLAPLEFPTS